jgi:uncharacterized repeat protein (TIGR01451 family)
MPVRALRIVLLLSLISLVPANGASSALESDSIPIPTADNFELVGHSPLLNRGMNSALAIHGDYAYVGSRTDASGTHANPGILVVDISDPAAPIVTGEIGPPNAGNAGESSRELRMWPDEELLIVMNLRCDMPTHDCPSSSITPTIKFFDVSGSNAAAPQLVSTYTPSLTPHEMYLWFAPDGRVLLYLSTWKAGIGTPDLIVTDITNARAGTFTEIATFLANQLFSVDDRNNHVIRLHSMGVNEDGTRTYVAYQGGGVLVLDTSDIAANVANPQILLLTPIGSQPVWGDPGAHSAVKVPGRDLVLTTDEAYGNRPGGGFQSVGCPWGWMRLLDISDETSPTIVSEHRIAQNDPAYCDTPEGMDPLNTWFTSYSSHNPTVLSNLAFMTWHSGGLLAVDLTDPADPNQVGLYIPEPLLTVTTEDPALSRGTAKVVMWSYPIIRDGLIYVVDIRNGLYILRYTGPGAEDVAAVSFLEGNSNLPNDGADLSLTKSDSQDRAPVGRDLTYTLTVVNGGPDPATGVTVTDQLPSSVSFVSATASQGSCGESNGTVFCTLGTVPVGTPITIDIVVRPTQAGPITNSASVASPTADPDQTNNADSEDTSVCRITSRRSSIPCG